MKKFTESLTKEQRQESFDFLVKSTVEVEKIPIEEAKKRVTGLFESGILDNFDPRTKVGQLAIDAFMSMPSSNYDFLRN